MTVYPDPKQLLNDPRIKESLEKLRQMLPELKEKRDYYRRTAKEEKANNRKDGNLESR